jgi:hypothetical protein
MSETTPATAAQPSTESWGAPIIATISVVNLLVFGGLAVWLKNDNLLLLIGGAIIANATTAAQFYLGSSSGSQKKDAVIANQLAASPTLPPVPPTHSI